MTTRIHSKMRSFFTIRNTPKSNVNAVDRQGKTLLMNANLLKFERNISGRIANYDHLRKNTSSDFGQLSVCIANITFIW